MVDAKRKVYRRAQLATDRARRAYRVFYIIYIFTRYRVSNDLFFAEYKTFIFRSRVFSRTLGPGERRGSTCTPRHKRESPPGSVARALGVQSREIWQKAITESTSAELEPTKTMENQHISRFAPLL